VVYLIHLWVEGFFEVFATVVIAYLCSEWDSSKNPRLCVRLLTTILYLGSGVIGTSVLSVHRLLLQQWERSFSLGVVPLTLIGFEVLKTLKLSQVKGFYRWPLRFLYCHLFWNLVGAGVFSAIN